MPCQRDALESVQLALVSFLPREVRKECCEKTEAWLLPLFFPAKSLLQKASLFFLVRQLIFQIGILLLPLPPSPFPLSTHSVPIFVKEIDGNARILLPTDNISDCRFFPSEFAWLSNSGAFSFFDAGFGWRLAMFADVRALELVDLRLGLIWVFLIISAKNTSMAWIIASVPVVSLPVETSARQQPPLFVHRENLPSSSVHVFLKGSIMLGIELLSAEGQMLEAQLSLRTEEVTTSQKMVTQKRYGDGLKAPRNSLELPVETLSYYAMHSNIPKQDSHYSYHLKQNTSRKKGYPNRTLVKQLIDEEISKPKESRRHVPSVVAQLMGMDVLPTNKNSIIQAQERKMENTSKNIARKEKVEAVDTSTQSSPLNPKLLKKSKMLSLPRIKKQDADEANCLKFAKQHPQEHPQEEQLQKFKKEFEAWQASKIQKLRWSTEMDDSQRQQSFAQENLSMKKMARNANAMRNSVVKDPGELTCYACPITEEMNMRNRNTSQHYGYRKKPVERNSLEDSLNRSVTTDCVQFTQTPSDFQCNRSSVPTRIVILKPGIERGSNTESWPGSPDLVEDNFSIEDFLEEVKERLRFEVQRNIQTDNRVSGAETETPFHDGLTGSKEIAQHIAKHARERVTKGIGINLVRSGSTRSCTNELQCNETGSPEFLNRDTRRLLSERLRNVLRNEIDSDGHPGISGKVITSMVDGGNDSPDLMEDMQENRQRISQQEYMEDEHKTKVRSCRYAKDEAFARGELSPRNLVRSLSTPVPGTAFGKLLSEEPPLLTGAHIRRKHEAADNFSKELGKSKKERFSFRGRVSNLRHNLTLKGMLFGKIIQAMKESRAKESEYVEASIALPTVLLNSCSAQARVTDQLRTRLRYHQALYLCAAAIMKISLGQETIQVQSPHWISHQLKINLHQQLLERSAPKLMVRAVIYLFLIQ
ncbi:hypothetical protein ACLOJK_018433 [Asimina triloba]